MGPCMLLLPTGCGPLTGARGGPIGLMTNVWLAERSAQVRSISGGSALVFIGDMTLTSNILGGRGGREKNKPECLWRAGVATQDVTCAPPSEPMKQSEYRHWQQGGTGIVYTDGSAKNAKGARYAGRGIWPEDPNLVAYGPLRGYDQTAARAEVRPIVAAAEIAQGNVRVISDNKLCGPSLEQHYPRGQAP